MPIYDYQCTCGFKFETFQSVEKRKQARCPKCGKPASLKFNPANVIPQIFTPYTDEHIDDEPVFIETRQQKKDILKRKGLVESG